MTDTDYNGGCDCHGECYCGYVPNTEDFDQIEALERLAGYYNHETDEVPDTGIFGFEASNLPPGEMFGFEDSPFDFDRTETHKTFRELDAADRKDAARWEADADSRDDFTLWEAELAADGYDDDLYVWPGEVG